MEMLRVVILAVVLACALSATPLKIISVIDQGHSSYKTDIEHALLHENNNAAVLPGYTLQSETVFSQDNDSFGAMDAVCSKITSGVSLIIDASSRHVTSTIQSLAANMGITLVSVTDQSYQTLSTPHPMNIEITPPGTVMLQVIRDIVSKENLTNVGIIYDSTFDLDDKPKRLLRNIPAQHLYMRMGMTTLTIDAQMEKIKSAELSHLFLVASGRNAERYLGRANSKQMMTFKFHWFVLTKDAKINCLECKTDSSVVLMQGRYEYNAMVSYVNAKKAHLPSFDTDDIQIDSAFLHDLSTMVSRALDTLTKANSYTQLNYQNCYTFNGTNSTAYAQSVALANKIKVTPSNGVFGNIKFDSIGARPETKIKISRVTFKDGAISKSENIGNWSQANGLYASQGSITNKNSKKKYRVVTVHEPPFMFKDPKKTGNDRFTGYCKDLLEKIAKELQFDYDIKEPADGLYGSMQADGSWNGMINMLIKDEADIVVAPLSVMAERESVIDFTVPYYDLVGITILMEKPKFEYKIFRFMSVLEASVWGCVVAAFFLVSILLCIFDRYSPYSYQNNKTRWDGQGEEPRVFTLKEGLWFCMTSLTPQGGGEAPRALSGRLVAATWWIFGFIMIATYTANLAAFLTVSRLDQPIESLDDLAKQFKTKYAPQKGTSTETYFRRMADIEEKFYSIWKAMSLNDSLDEIERAKLAVWDYPVSDKFTNMWVSMRQSELPTTFENAIDRVLNDNFAFIGDATKNKYAAQSNCDLWTVGEEFSRKPYALAVQEGSPLRSEISSVILQLLNQRTLEEFKTQWWSYNKKKCPKIEDESDGISLDNIGGVFLVIFIGIGLGLITLGFEFYWYRYRPQRQQANENQVVNIKESQANNNPAYVDT